MRFGDRLLALCLALTVLVNAGWCACGRAATTATTRPADPPCCRHDPAATDDGPRDCPHCAHARPAVAAANGPTVLPPTVPFAIAPPRMPPACASAAAFVGPNRDTAPGRPSSLTLRLHCALSL